MTRIGVVTFPGTLDDRDALRAVRLAGADGVALWHADADLRGVDAVILPGGFSYGDYLRCGAIARFSPIMDAVGRFAQQGRPVMGICNGFQILTEAHLLPGALIRNSGLKFICAEVALYLEDSVCQWLTPQEVTSHSRTAAENNHQVRHHHARQLEATKRVVRLPINHNEGNYICDVPTLAKLQAQGQIVLRYCAPDGSCLADGSAPNGALDNIAGICNRQGNVFGLMPHPERVCDGISGNTDGASFFNTIAQTLRSIEQ
ncbi:MAG: phosphoribosylformylglycinamidine synthase subunit PurQ [Coriobacteriales bacterium]|jgi:phosphoribosylformylglycinamidine synthase|nr:phosphoribosylformylglycinamidine synthase subunit PurQ [Coriobacteriales bacterium]